MAFGEGGGGDATAPLLSSDRPKGHPSVVRNGNEWTASAHVITAVIGSGVLSLAWSMAQLGWVAGPGMMVVFASVTALQSTIFADCYRSPDPEHGPHRNRTYAHAVERNLGSTSAWVCQLLQQTALFGYGVAYTITASISFSMRENVVRKLERRAGFPEPREGTVKSTKELGENYRMHFLGCPRSRIQSGQRRHILLNNQPAVGP